MTHNAQIIDRSSTHLIGIAHGLHAQFGGQLCHFLTDVGQRLNEIGHGGMAHFGLDQGFDLLAKFFQRCALVAQHFTAQQIE